VWLKIDYHCRGSSSVATFHTKIPINKGTKQRSKAWRHHSLILLFSFANLPLFSPNDYFSLSLFQTLSQPLVRLLSLLRDPQNHFFSVISSMFASQTKNLYLPFCHFLLRSTTTLLRCFASCNLFVPWRCET